MKTSATISGRFCVSGGFRFGKSGKKSLMPHDDNLLPLLHRLKRVTLFTQDEDFFRARLCHRAYCLVWLNVKYIGVAAYIRRFLRHPQFRAQAQRMGKVVRVHPDSLHFWQAGKAGRVLVKWSEA